MEDLRKQRIREFILGKKIVTLDELKGHVHNNVTMTIMRKLKELSYLSSYSHRGKYYTLASIPEFSELGLWSYESVHFSKYDTLINTCLQIITNSQSGYSIKELDEVLQVSTRLSALNLYKEGKLFRASFAAEQVYFSSNNQFRKSQITLRESQYTNRVFSVGRLSPQIITEELKAAIILFYSTLNEKQRRLYAGLESVKIGYGGDKLLSSLLQISPETVSKGRQELASGNFQQEGVRKSGAGRPGIKKNTRNNPSD